MRFEPIDPVALNDRVMRRFFAQTERSESGCLIWRGTTKYDGYGQVSIGMDGGKPVRRYAHRVAWVYANAQDVPEGWTIDHLCDNPSRVEAAHLRPATIGANVLRSGKAFVALNARKTHCPSGHEYTDENVRMYRGGRNCRACNRDRMRARYVRIGK
jgi:hypothetical protein